MRQQAKSWSQMMFVWGWQMHRFYGLWIAASVTFKLMCIKIATVCTMEKLHCISIKICIWYCTSRFWKKMNCIVQCISLNNLFNKTTFSYICCFIGLSGLVFQILLFHELYNMHVAGYLTNTSSVRKAVYW